jgi:hypothetical protein
MASFDIRVINDDEEPLEGIRVKIEFTSALRGMSDEERTDSDGLVSFSGYDEGEIRVYLDGANYGEYQYEDGEEITITK